MSAPGRAVDEDADQSNTKAYQMESFWTVQFEGVQGMGAGVITLIGGQLFGSVATAAFCTKAHIPSGEIT